MEPVLVSAGLVALAEIGDKTQLLAIILAAKFRKAVADHPRHYQASVAESNRRELLRKTDVYLTMTSEINPWTKIALLAPLIR